MIKSDMLVLGGSTGTPPLEHPFTQAPLLQLLLHSQAQILNQAMLMCSRMMPPMPSAGTLLPTVHTRLA